MGLKLNGSTSGSVQLNAPASTTSGADVVLTLPVNDGDANQVLTTNGSGALSWVTRPTRVNRTYSSEVSVASGDTEIEFTGIPANATRILLIFRELSLSGTDNLRIQIGHAGSGGTYFTSDYDCFGTVFGGTALSVTGNTTTGFRLVAADAGVTLQGIAEIIPNAVSSPSRYHAFIHASNTAGTSGRFNSGESPDTSSVTIDRIKILPDGTNTFDNAAGRCVMVTEVVE